VKRQPHFKTLVQKLERFDVRGDFTLTELGHGLDEWNIETTATLSQDGKHFDFHSPSLDAAKSSIGHCFAYDSACQSGLIRQELIDVWEANCILEDAAWYVEHNGILSRDLHEKRILAVDRVKLHLQSVIDDFDMSKHHGTKPLVSRSGWNGFLRERTATEQAVVWRHGGLRMRRHHLLEKILRMQSDTHQDDW
jgi:hypothetical protein